MSLNTPIELSQPTVNELKERSENDVLVELPTSIPFTATSFLNAFITAQAGRNSELYTQIQQLLDAAFLSSSSGAFVDKWAAIFNLLRLSATQATGPVNFEGTAGTLIPIGTILQSSVGNIYTTDADATLTFFTNPGVSGTIMGITVTLTLSSHGLATGNSIIVSGAVEAPINGIHEITVIDTDTFSYDVTGTVSPGAIGPLTVYFTIATPNVTSQDFGADQNVGTGPQIALQSQIAGVANNGQGYVPVAEIKGGSDEETSDGLRDRTITRLQNPIAEFSSSDILEQVKLLKLNDQTVVVKPFETPATPPSPEPGQVIIISVIIEPDGTTVRNPTLTEKNLIKAQLDTITPANCIDPSVGDANVFVTEPLAFFNIDVQMTGLLPGTSTMETAISNALKAFFADTATVSQADPELFSTTEITMNQITTVIGSTVDPDTGKPPVDFSFTLNGGTSDISIPTHQRPVLQLPVGF